jgi:hypothetical protein
MATLRDLALEAFVTASVHDLPVTAPEDRWAVLVSDGAPVSAIAPGESVAAGARPPGILIAEAGTPRGEAFRSAAFAAFFEGDAEVSALVLIQGPAGAYSQVAGVAGADALVQAMLSGATKGFSDTTLPGTPDIPLICRSCGFTNGGVMCATTMRFASRPFGMPPCDNKSGLTPHDFTW